MGTGWSGSCCSVTGEGDDDITDGALRVCWRMDGPEPGFTAMYLLGIVAAAVGAAGAAAGGGKVPPLLAAVAAAAALAAAAAAAAAFIRSRMPGV
jgi:hypothetical protein